MTIPFKMNYDHGNAYGFSPERLRVEHRESIRGIYPHRYSPPA